MRVNDIFFTKIPKEKNFKHKTHENLTTPPPIHPLPFFRKNKDKDIHNCSTAERTNCTPKFSTPTSKEFLDATTV